MKDVHAGTPGRFERLLSGARVQRWVAALLSLLGLGSVALVLGFLEFRPLLDAGRARPLSLFMHELAVAALLAMTFTAAGLGLFLAWRGHRRELSRLLGLSSSALACGFGVFFSLRSFVLSRNLRDDNLHAYMGAVVALLVFSVVVTAVWMYATARFVLMFPKPVKLAGIDYAAQGWNQVRLRTEWKWSWLWSPQGLALLAGVGLIMAVCTDDLLPSDQWGYVTAYIVTWVPFAVLSAKQARLDEAGRRAIRWVLAGQSAWLLLFLLSMLVIIAARHAGVLQHAGWNDLKVFTNAFFTIAFAGFLVVFLLTLAFSILYDGTLDPDLMLSRTWLLAALGMLSGVVFVLIERLAAGLFAEWFGLSTVDALTLVAILTAVVVYPMRRVAESFIHGLMERWQADTVIAKGERKEASVVFADLSGYTRLTEQDEQAALLMAGVFHRDAHQAARQHGGRVIKTIGDAVMLEFSDADAAWGGIETLRATFASHIEALSLKPLPIHAGIHHGEVVKAPNGDLFGAAVNLAARLLGAAGPDEVVASGAAVRGRALESRGIFLGERTFKNVSLPVPCYRLS